MRSVWRGILPNLISATLACDVPALYRVWTSLLFRGVAVVGKPIKIGSGPEAALVSPDGLDGAAFYEALPSDGRAIRFR